MNQPKTKQKDHSLYKQIGVAAVTFVFFVIFWFVLYRFFNSPEAAATLTLSVFSQALNLVLLLLGMFIMGLLIGLVGILVRRWAIIAITYSISLAFFFIFFPFKLISLLAVIVFLLLLFWGYRMMRDEVKGRRKINLYKILKYGVPAALTAISIVVSVVYYISFSAKVEQQGLQVPQSSLESAVGPLEDYIAQNYVPGFKKDMTVDDVTYALLLDQLKKDQQAEGKVDLPPGLIEVLQEEGVDIYNKEETFLALEQDPQVKNKASQFIKTDSDQVETESFIDFKEFGVSGETQVIEAIREVINQKLNESIGPYKKYVAVILAISFYISLQFFSVFIAWLVYGAAWLVFKILRSVEFVQVAKEQQEVESIKL